MKKIKRFILFFSLVFCLSMLSGCTTDGSSTTPTGESTEKYLKNDVSPDICKTFDADFVYSATGKTIVKVEPSIIPTVYSCNYYTDYKEDFYQGYNGGPRTPGGPFIDIVLDNINVERHKKNVQTLGMKLETSEKIKMEHFIVRRSKDNSVWEVAIVLTPDKFIWTNSLNKALTDEELIDFGSKLSEKISNQLSFEIKSNPIVLENSSNFVAKEEDIAKNFFQKLSDKKFQEAVDMMDADEQTKQGWLTNFSYLESVKIINTEQAFKEEWTSDRQVYKFELDVKIKSGGEQFGWENGKNFRWITLQKNGETWQVHELANNP